MATQGDITVSGAREHNLKDLHLSLPRDALVVITGLSGSGKSSLAFDTIYAEGQRRYVESLSAYARQFLGQMDKPDVDSIEGLSPAISIDQKTTSRNPRSTVGTVTEIYDYLRLLWARIGAPHCYNCGEPIEAQSAEQIVDHVMTLPEGTKFMVEAPVVRGRKGEYKDAVRGAARRGLHARQGRRRAAPARGGHRPRQEVQARHLGRDRPARDAARPAQAADGLGRDRGRARRGARRHRGRRRRARSPTYSERFMCLQLRHVDAGARAADVLVQLAARRLPALHRARLADGDRPGADRARTRRCRSTTGRSCRGRRRASNYYEQMTQAIAEKWEVDVDTPVGGPRRGGPRHCFLYGTNGDKLYISYRNRYGRRRSYMTTLRGHRHRTSSGATARPTRTGRARRSRST